MKKLLFGFLLLFSPLAFGANNVTVATFEKCVAAAATPEALTASATLSPDLIIQAKTTNTQPVLVGNSSAQHLSVPVGGVVILESHANREYDLSKIYVKVGVNGECVSVLRTVPL